MKIKLKLGDIIVSEEAVKNLSKEKLPVKLSWNLQKNIKKIFEEIQDFNDKINGFFREYGTLLEDGNITVDPKVSKEGYANFLKDRNELLDTDIELDLLLIPLVELEESGVKLSSEDLLLYSYMIEEKTE